MSAPDGIDLDRQIARMKEEFESCKILHGEGSEWAIEAGSILASLIELQDARITAALAEKESGGWIAVSERLPETDKTVLVDGGIAYQRNGGWFSLTGIEYPGRLIQWNVTHWRPLPPLPTERKV